MLLVAESGAEVGGDGMSMEGGGRVELLEELYGNLAPALHDAPWLEAAKPGPGGLTPSQEGTTGANITPLVGVL